MLVVTLLFFKFLPKKYDFNLHNRLIIHGKKKPQIHQILKIFKKFMFSNCHIFMISSVGSQEYRRILFFFPPPLLSYLVCSQIWLNYNNCHFGYIPKTLKDCSPKAHTQIVYNFCD
jgi:hypothetical protein